LAHTLVTKKKARKAQAVDIKSDKPVDPQRSPNGEKVKRISAEKAVRESVNFLMRKYTRIEIVNQHATATMATAVSALKFKIRAMKYEAH
jgi:fructose-specific phosphotransferase system component IIB